MASGFTDWALLLSAVGAVLTAAATVLVSVAKVIAELRKWFKSGHPSVRDKKSPTDGKQITEDSEEV